MPCDDGSRDDDDGHDAAAEAFDMHIDGSMVVVVVVVVEVVVDGALSGGCETENEEARDAEGSARPHISIVAVPIVAGRGTSDADVVGGQPQPA